MIVLNILNSLLIYHVILCYYSEILYSNFITISIKNKVVFKNDQILFENFEIFFICIKFILISLKLYLC